MKPHPNDAHRRICDAVFQHLEWRDVRSMLGSLAEVEEGSSGADHRAAPVRAAAGGFDWRPASPNCYVCSQALR